MIKITKRVLGVLISLSVLLGILVTVGAWTYQRNMLILGGVQRAEFIDSTKSLREDESRIHAAVDTLGFKILGIMCHDPKNRVSDFCKGVR